MIGKRRWIAVAVLFVFTGVLMVCYHRSVKKQRLQEEIADAIIRLHVVANSDSEEDQALKQDVRDVIVTYLRDRMAEANTVEEARVELKNALPEVQKLAQKTIREEGFGYDADATLGQCYFPVKQYGDLIFPAGEYEALKVTLGESEGKNWWCVMYPTLCFVDSAYQIVPEESKEKLRISLTDEEYTSLLDGGSSVEYGSGVIEWLQNTFFS